MDINHPIVKVRIQKLLRHLKTHYLAVTTLKPHIPGCTSVNPVNGDCYQYPAIGPPGSCSTKAKVLSYAFVRGKCLPYYPDGCQGSKNSWRSKSDCYESRFREFWLWNP